MKAFLLVDIIGSFKKVTYGRAGDEVSIISSQESINAEHENTVTVMNIEGSKFSILKSELSYNPTKTPSHKIDTQSSEAPIPLPLSKTIIPTKKTKTKGKQSSLF